MEKEITYLSPAKDEWYILLVDDLKTIIIERTWVSNLEKITCKHEVGKRALEDYYNFERKYIYGKKIASVLSLSIGRKGWGRREIQRCIKFAKMYPNLTTFLATVPKGKALTWNWIVTNILTENKGEENDENKQKSNSGGKIKQIDKLSNVGNKTTRLIPFSSPDKYKEWVRTQPCCVCGSPPPSTFAHFPATKARKDEHWGIPLCGICHREQEDGGASWCWDYRRKWARFLFGLIINV